MADFLKHPASQYEEEDLERDYLMLLSSLILFIFLVRLNASFCFYLLHVNFVLAHVREFYPITEWLLLSEDRI